MDHILCRTCGKRHPVGKCPLAFDPLTHPPIKDMKPTKARFIVDPVKVGPKDLEWWQGDVKVYGMFNPPDLIKKAAKPATKPLTTPPKSVTQKVTVTQGVTNRAKVKHCPTCTCQRVHASKAAKQRAYRERKAMLKGMQLIADKKVIP